VIIRFKKEGYLFSYYEEHKNSNLFIHSFPAL